MLIPGLPDTIGTILGVADTIGKLVNSNNDSVPEVVERTPVVVQQPSYQPPSPSKTKTDQTVNINLTINLYTEDGKLIGSMKKSKDDV